MHDNSKIKVVSHETSNQARITTKVLKQSSETARSFNNFPQLYMLKQIHNPNGSMKATRTFSNCKFWSQSLIENVTPEHSLTQNATGSKSNIFQA